MKYLVVHLHGLNRDGSLPGTDRNALHEAVRLSGVCAYDRLLAGMWNKTDARSNRLAVEHTLREFGGAACTTELHFIVKNSVDEVQQFTYDMNECGAVSNITIVSDQHQVGTLERMYQKIGPVNTSIKTVGVHSDWQRNHPSFWCRSNLAWRIGCIIRSALWTVLGPHMKIFNHPTSR